MAPDIECTNSLDIAAIAIGVIIAQAAVEAGFAKPRQQACQRNMHAQIAAFFRHYDERCKTG